MSRAFIMKINSAPAAIVHSLIIQAAIMASHPNSLTQVSTNQSPSAYQKPTRYKSTINQARGKAVFLLVGYYKYNYCYCYCCLKPDCKGFSLTNSKATCDLRVTCIAHTDDYATALEFSWKCVNHDDRLALSQIMREWHWKAVNQYIA